jgi:hypothetical protein
MPGGDMTRAAPEATTARAGWRSRRWWLPALVGGGVVAALLVAWVVHTAGTRAQPPASALPLRPVGEVALPGDGSRFDYASLDAQRGLLFVAHLGASEVIEVDVRAHRVVRSIANIDQVHGVFVVPDLHRVYATATGANTMIILNEDTGEQIGHAPTGAYPDGLAYDPRRGAIWTTNETGGSETVLDAATGAVRGTVALGADVGNVVYDPTADQMLVAVQGTNQLAVIDPTTLAVAKTLALPGCEHPHGLALSRVIGWSSWPATAMPRCSPWTWGRGRSPAPTRSAMVPMSWRTIRAHAGSTSPPKAVGSPSSTCTVASSPP